PSKPGRAASRAPADAVRCALMASTDSAESTETSESSGANTGVPDSLQQTSGRVSFERLRERTDELELLISGLALFALLGMPGWLWERFETFYARMPVEVVAGVIVLLPILS